MPTALCPVLFQDYQADRKALLLRSSKTSGSDHPANTVGGMTESHNFVFPPVQRRSSTTCNGESVRIGEIGLIDSIVARMQKIFPVRDFGRQFSCRVFF